MSFHDFVWLYAVGFWFVIGCLTALATAYVVLGIISLIVNAVWGYLFPKPKEEEK